MGVLKNSKSWVKEHALNPWFFADSFMRIINSLKIFKNLELGVLFLIKL
jgi:hypothetical protein